MFPFLLGHEGLLVDEKSLFVPAEEDQNERTDYDSGDTENSERDVKQRYLSQRSCYRIEETFRRHGYYSI
jgi:hypothetical protein